MKTLPASEYNTPELELKSLWITSEQLSDLCSKIDKICGPVCIVKEQPDGTKLVYEGPEEISSHAASIQVPFSIESSGPEVKLYKYQVRISYKRSQEAEAKTIFSELNMYSPPILSNSTRFSFALIFLSLVLGQMIIALGDVAPLRSLPNLYASSIFSFICIALAISLQLFTFPSLGFLVRVKHVRKDTFLQRNKDRIIFVILGTTLGAIATYIIGPLFLELPSVNP